MNIFGNMRKKKRAENRLIDRFREKGAVSIDLALDPGEIGDLNRSAFNRLCSKGVFERGGGNTWFLSERGLMKTRMDRVKWAMILLFASLAIIFLFYGG